VRLLLVVAALGGLIAGAPSSASSTKAQVRKAVLRYLRAEERGDAKIACAMLSPAGLEDAGYRNRRACRRDVEETGGSGPAPNRIHRIVMESPTQADVFVDDGDVVLSRYPGKGWLVDVG
jgi:hypothetical protein